MGQVVGQLARPAVAPLSVLTAFNDLLQLLEAICSAGVSDGARSGATKGYPVTGGATGGARHKRNSGAAVNGAHQGK